MIPNPTPCPRCGYPAPAAASGGASCRLCALRPPPAGAAATRRAGFADGLGAFFRGIGFLFSKSRTKRVAVLPACISTVVFSVMLWLLWTLTAGIRESTVSASWMPGWLQGIASFVVGSLVLLVFVVLAWFTAAPITTAIAGPFLDLLVARVDEEVMGTRPSVEAGIVRDTAFGVLQAALVLGFTVALGIGAFLLNFVPAAGTAASFVVMAFGLGFSAIDLPASRRRFTFGQKLAVASANLGAVLGFGLGSVLLAPIACLNVLLGIPVSALGGTLLFHRLDLRPAVRRR